MKKLLSVSKGSNVYYNVLVNNNIEHNCVKKWNSKLSYDVNWKLTFHKIKKIHDISLRWFQMRIVHRIISTNVILKQMGITLSETCSFCNKEKDSIIHCFWRCDYTYSFWQTFENWINVHCNNACNFKLSESYVLFATDHHLKTDSILDFIVLLAKQYVFSCKYKKERPLLHVFKHKLTFRYRLEKYNAMLSQNLPQFDAKWFYYVTLVRETV